MPHSETSSVSLTALREQVASRLAVVRRALLGHFLAEGVARMLVVTIGLLLLSLGLDWWLDLSFTARMIYWGVVLSAAAGLLFWFVIRPWRLPLGPIDIAAALDQKRAGPPLASQVASVIQLVDANPDQVGESAAMREQAVRASHAALEQIDFRSALNPKHVWVSLAVTVVALLLPAGIALAFPSTAQLWAERWFAGSDRPWPRSTRIEIEGVQNGVLRVPRGEVFTLQARVTDDKQPTHTVHLRQRPAEGKTQTHTLEKFADGDFRLQLPPQQLTSRIEVWGGDSRAEPFRIEPVDRPRIMAMTLQAQGPRDTEPKTYDFKATDSAVRLTSQTAAHFEFETNVECQTVKIESTSTTMGQFTRTSPLRHAVDWVHTEPVSLRVVLVSTESGLESHPQSITIGDLPDRAPRFSVRHSGVRLRVTPTATIPMTISARDDFGVYRVALSSAVAALAVKVVDDEDVPEAPGKEPPPTVMPSEPAVPEPMPEAAAAEAPSAGASPATTEPPVVTPAESNPLPTGPTLPVAATELVLYGPATPALETQVDQEHNFELSMMTLVPGQTLIIQGTAEDDSITGRQVTRSSPIVFRIVKPEELFRDILQRQQQLRARLSKARDQADVLTTKIPFAFTAEEAQGIARQHQVITREVGQVTQGLEATLVEMKLNKLGGDSGPVEATPDKPATKTPAVQAWELLSQIVIQPLQTLGNVDLPSQRQNLESLVQRPGERLDEIGVQQKKIVADMDKILKNMAQWDSFIEIVNRVEQLKKSQTGILRLTEELLKQADQLRQKEADSIFDK